jgi:hypothetical protein
MLKAKAETRVSLTLRYVGLGVSSGVVNRVGQPVNDAYYSVVIRLDGDIQLKYHGKTCTASSVGWRVRGKSWRVPA